MKAISLCAAVLALSTSFCAAAGTYRTVIAAPANGVYVGAYVGARSSEQSCSALSRNLGRTLPICDTYYAIQTLPKITNDRETLDIASTGSIPLGTLGCRGNGSPMSGGRTTFARIASGELDPQLTRDAEALKAYAAHNPKNPLLFLRLFHEFNVNTGNPRGNPNGNNCFSMPEDVAAMQQEFVAAWQHVVTYLQGQGVTNVTWVWCPATGPQAWERHGGDDFLKGFYPGDQYVDWTCADTYDKAPRGGGATNAFQHLEFFKQFNKPLMIAETGECNSESGSRGCAGYQHTQAEFISDAARSLKPGGYLYSVGVKAWVYFDNDVERSGYNWSLDRQGIAALKAMMDDPYFHPAMPQPKSVP